MFDLNNVPDAEPGFEYQLHSSKLQINKGFRVFQDAQDYLATKMAARGETVRWSTHDGGLYTIGWGKDPVWGVGSIVYRRIPFHRASRSKG